MEYSTVAIVFTAIRYLALLAPYVGFIAVTVFVSLMSHLTDGYLADAADLASQAVRHESHTAAPTATSLSPPISPPCNAP